MVYGIHAVGEALRSRPMDYVLVAEGQHNPRVQQIIDACRAEGISLRFAPREALERAAGSVQHQNVVAVCAPKAYDDLEALLSSPQPLLVVLDGVEDPANLGAVIRTAVGAGAAGVVIPERRAAGLSPAVARAAAARPTAAAKGMVRTTIWVESLLSKSRRKCSSFRTVSAESRCASSTT